MYIYIILRFVLSNKNKVMQVIIFNSLKRGERWGICDTRAAGYPKGDMAFPDSLGLFPMKSIPEFYQPAGRISKWCDDKED